MSRPPSRTALAGGLIAATLAAAVAVGSWLGERSLGVGRSAQRRGHFAAADAAYRTGAALGSADAAAERARLCLARGDWACAEVSLRAALALGPARALPHVLRARLDAERPGPGGGARTAAVLDSCRRATELEPQRAETRRECAGLALAVAAEGAGAGAAADRARAEAAAGYAEALAIAPEAARETLEQALSHGAGPRLLVDVSFRRVDGRILAALVGALADHSLWEREAPACWAAAESADDAAVFAAAAAEALAKRSRVREALAAAGRGLASRPADLGLAASVADLTARLPADEALAAAPLYRQVLARDPRNAAVRRRFARWLLGRGMLEDAVQQARALVDGDARDAEGWYLLGEGLRRGGRPAEAAAAYRAAADLRPASAVYRRAAGRS